MKIGKAIVLLFLALVIMFLALWAFFPERGLYFLAFALIAYLIGTLANKEIKLALDRERLKAKQEERERIATQEKAKNETFQRTSRREYSFSKAKRENALRLIRDMKEKGSTRPEMLAFLESKGIKISMRTFDRYLDKTDNC